jgi:hypothetical protein
MLKRLRMPFALALLAAGLAPAPAADADSAKAKSNAPFVHVVVFYAKEGVPPGAADELIADCHEMLAKIPSVRALRAGRPAERSTPGRAKKDYLAALMILFDDAEGLAAYDQHPLHKQFVEKHREKFDVQKLQVFDFLDGKK